MDGLVFDIKRFAIHDGDGIRTTVFLKGCPLRCQWCQNPEGLQFEKKVWYFSNRCLHCYQCIEACPQHALRKSKDSYGNIIINYEKCDACGICTDICSTNALSFDSKVYSTDELLVEVMKDQQFFTVSGGGVTVSGGDPVYQHEFVEEFLTKCKINGLQTTIESSLYTSEPVVKEFIPIVDKFIIDMKLFDSELHERYTGKPNEIIKRNISFLLKANADVLIRIPLIPNYTASEENIKQITRFVRSLSLTIPIEVVNFNNLPRNKYEMLGLDFPFTMNAKPFPEKKMEYFMNLTKKDWK